MPRSSLHDRLMPRRLTKQPPSRFLWEQVGSNNIDFVRPLQQGNGACWFAIFHKMGLPL